MCKFRKLKASEIECRVATVTQRGVTLLLYKDARVDQNLLDETVGPMNWQRTHQLIGDRLYCTVSVWDVDKGQWINKQDVGTESYTEKEKGQASDSFKRACFNLGIGRELYTAPFIWVRSDLCKIAEKNGKPACYDHFDVKEIQYDGDTISYLRITNADSGQEVYVFGRPKAAEKPKPAPLPANAPIAATASDTSTNGRIEINNPNAADIERIAKEVGDKLAATPMVTQYQLVQIEKMLKEKGIFPKQITDRYKVTSIRDLTEEQADHCIKSLIKSRGKKTI